MDNFSLEISNLTKTYKTKSGWVKALNNVNLNVPKGSFFGLLGPNGAGKTTLINIIATLVEKDSGKISICNQNFDQNRNQVKYKLGIVPQELILDPFFTVRESLEIYAGYYGVKKNHRKTEEIVSALGLEDKIDSKPRSLSGGMRRRLLIAKALVHDPDIIILDEPTAGVDIDLREQLWNYIGKLNNLGKTIILTTHYLEEVEKLCDYVAIINKGEIVANDRKQKLKEVFGEKKITIEFSKISKDLINKLEKYGRIESDKKCVTLQYKIDRFDYLDFIKKLGDLDTKILDIKTEESSIEDIFKHLITQNKELV